MSARFRPDNTDGYSAADLAALNAAWELIASAAPQDPDPLADDLAIQSMLDHWEACLLDAYGRGLRGDALVAWFYDDSAHEARP